MKLLEREHWLVKLNYIASATVFLFSFAAFQHTKWIQEYTNSIWSFEYIGITSLFGLCAFVIAGICMNFGFIIVSFVYCVCTHDSKVHWLARMIVSAKNLIDRPRWIANHGF